MNRLARLIHELPLEDLALIRKDVESGNLLRLLHERITTLSTRNAVKICVTCGRELELHEQKYSLEFGPVGLRQRAWFDELDCLNHFLEEQRASKQSHNNPSRNPSPAPSHDSNNHSTSNPSKTEARL